ncbi:MAG: hypothetical protein QME96_00955 [Myxococcota bacterium]|nr:hypothetical protein [Myxococcota bacterium]
MPKRKKARKGTARRTAKTTRKSAGVAEALATVKKAGTFLAALENPENAAVLAVMQDPDRGKMTPEAIERGKTLLVGAKAALGDTATGKAELPVVTTGVLSTMGKCREVLKSTATQVRGYLKDNPADLPADEVKTLLGAFNRLIGGSTGQAAFPARVRALAKAGRRDPSKSAMAGLMRDAGISEKDLANAERVAGAATGTDARQETRKGGKVTTVAAKDAAVGSLKGWCSRWFGVAYDVLAPEQQAVLGLPRRVKGGRSRKRQPGDGGGETAPK